MGKRLKAIPWLDEPTRAEATKKWSLMAKNVG
jgi:hypothetical protein